MGGKDIPPAVTSQGFPEGLREYIEGPMAGYHLGVQMSVGDQEEAPGEQALRHPLVFVVGAVAFSGGKSTSWTMEPIDLADCVTCNKSKNKFWGRKP